MIALRRQVRTLQQIEAFHRELKQLTGVKACLPHSKDSAQSHCLCVARMDPMEGHR
jgi:hypothetical protein